MIPTIIQVDELFVEREQGKQKKAHLDELFVEREQGKQKKAHLDEAPMWGFSFI